MDGDRGNGFGFGVGLVVGTVVGFAAGMAVLAASQRDNLDQVRARGIELTGRYGDQIRRRGVGGLEQARKASGDLLSKAQVKGPQVSISKAIAEGINAAKQRRLDLRRQNNGSAGEGAVTADDGEAEEKA